MTGESLPVKFRRGELCKMGSTVTRGEVEGTVQSTGGNTFFGEQFCPCYLFSFFTCDIVFSTVAILDLKNLPVLLGDKFSV
jgi:hypothetical protein